MKPKLLRTPEAAVIYPGEEVTIEQPLIGCFVTAALYSAAAVVTHCGPGMNDLTCKYHQELRPEPVALARLICLSLDLTTTTHWHRRRQEYRSHQDELLDLLATRLQVSLDRIEQGFYPAEAEISVSLTAAGELNFQGLSSKDSPLSSAAAAIY